AKKSPVGPELPPRSAATAAVAMIRGRILQSAAATADDATAAVRATVVRASGVGRPNGDREDHRGQVEALLEKFTSSIHYAPHFKLLERNADRLGPPRKGGHDVMRATSLPGRRKVLKRERLRALRGSASRGLGF